MKILFDQNLSRRLVDSLADVYPGSVHVGSVGLDTSTDRSIWEWAGRQGYAIVSKDSDFRQLAFLYGPPPKVVWLRVGNVPTAAIGAILRESAQRIASFIDDPDEALLVVTPPAE